MSTEKPSGLLFDDFKFPITFFEQYTDIVSGKTGVATGIVYTFDGRVSVLLNFKVKSGNKAKGGFISIDRLVEASEGASIDLSLVDIDYSHLVTPYAQYIDRATQLSGYAMGISFSANKCVQIEYAVRGSSTGDEDENGTNLTYYTSDIQNLTPVEESTKPHGISSNMAPGSATSISPLGPISAR